MAEQDSPPPTITAMKIPIIKKGEYDIWSMRMRQYICHTDHNLWDIIVDGDLQEEAAPAGEQPGPPAPKTAKQLTAKRNQERVKSILLLAIPDEYLLKQPVLHLIMRILQQIDQDDLEELDIRWQVACKTNKVNIEKPKSVHESVVPKPNINRDKVIIEDWYSDDEDDVFEVNTVSPVKTNETQTIRNRVNKIGQISQKKGIGFKKIKACFVCKSTDHLIKDCDFYAKKSPGPKLKTVVNTGQRVVKPVWDNAKRIKIKVTCDPDFGSTAAETCTLFWNTASSQTVNDVKQINATVDSKVVVVTEASIRSSLSFLTIADAEGEGSGEPTEPQPTPSPTQPSTGDQPPKTSSSHATTQDSRDSLEGTNGNEGDQVQTPHDSPLSGGHTSDRAEGALNLQELSVLCTNLSNRVLALESIKDAQAAEISALKSRIKKLEKKCKPSISHHRAWLKSVKRLSMKKRFGKQDTVFDDQDADHGMEYIDTEETMDEGRQSGEIEEVKLTDDIEVVKDKSSGDKGRNAEELVSTTRPEDSTAKPDINAARQENSVVEPRTPPTTTSIFDDEDITMAQTLIKMKEEKAKEKGVLIKDVDDSSRPARSILTLKPLPTIDPKDKGKGVLKESPVKKVKRSDLDAAQIAKDAEITRLIHEKELAKMEREREERQRQDQAYVDYIASLYDEVQVKMDASEKVPKEPESTKVEVKQEGREENIRKRSGRRLKMKATKKSKRQKTDSDLEEEEQLRASLKIVPDEEEEIDYEVLGMRYPIVNWESAFYHTDRYGVPHDYYRVFGAKEVRYSRLSLKWFQELIDLDFMTLHKLDYYENYGVHILALEDGTEIHMLAERRYPLIRETLERMMELRLTAESEGEAVFDLLRFIQK
ncbi:hypothetical protein Tco_0793590 [Tanacetum coccineum]